MAAIRRVILSSLLTIAATPSLPLPFLQPPCPILSKEEEEEKWRSFCPLWPSCSGIRRLPAPLPFCGAHADEPLIHPKVKTI